MKSLEVYDPPLCCATGVCGPDVDPALVQFASDLNWLAEHGVKVSRYNLAQQPSAFAANASVASALQSRGNACLPLVLVDGEIVTQSIHPTRAQLASLVGLQDGGCCGETPDEDCCGSGESCSDSGGDGKSCCS